MMRMASAQTGGTFGGNNDEEKVLVELAAARAAALRRYSNINPVVE